MFPKIPASRWLCIFLCVLSWMPCKAVAAEISKEYQLKAVFLFNFAQFVEWPADKFPDPQTPLVIGILGDDPFGAFLDDTVRGEKAGGHPLAVQRYRDVSEIKSCQILYISRSESSHLKQILGALKNRNILTVSDIKDFPEDGGVIGFVTEKNKIHLRVNASIAKSEALTLSSKLLRLAEIVTPRK